MTPLPVTVLYAGLLGLLYLGLSLRVVRYRQRHEVGLGDGGHADLSRSIRVHGNFAEYVPLLLVLMALIESNGGAAWGLHAIGALLFLVRAAHAYGLASSGGASAGRAVGAGGTLLLLLAASLWALAQGLGLA
jgi:uncharacterized membrane protein YecN with MAPEG domain